ncbi:LOW QUALITY PROTEIN: hypothetical protein PHMEG_00022942, partial [Phytophthora megakarya]
MSIASATTPKPRSVYASHVSPDEDELSFELQPGERRGWWEANSWDDSACSVAFVHGSVFHHRTLLVLDSGASTSIISLDLSRRLKLRVEPRGELLLNGIDGVKTKVTNKCRAKITLGHRVVYTLDVWVGNIGQGIDVLLGMNFMVAAGVRLCAHEREVVLPDEERILIVGGPKRSHLGRTIDVSIHETPGDSKYIPILTSEPDLESMDVWVSRGDRWVTLVVFSAKRVPVAVRVPHTKVATLTDRDRLPLGTNFVRPGSYQYDEREFLVYENTRSPAAERRLDAEVRELERNAPPKVDRPTYPSPTRVLRRTPETRTVVPDVPEAQCGNGSTPNDPPTAFAPGPGADHVMIVSGTSPRLVDPGPQVSRSEPSDPDAQASSGGEPAPALTASWEPVPVSPESAPMEAQVALARSFVMVAMAGKTLDAEPAVYYHQDSDFVLLDRPKNQLAYLPDLSDLRPEANIEDAIVARVSNPDEEERLRTVLRKHRMIFLGEGNALPPPARGVVCDLDVGDEKPISMRSRRIPADLLSKVFELLKRLLETGLIEYSGSEWASAIVLVMNKSDTDVRLCIDYRLVNQLIKLMNYPLPLIDELTSNFAATMWFMTLDMASGFWAAPMTARAQLIS